MIDYKDYTAHRSPTLGQRAVEVLACTLYALLLAYTVVGP